MKIFFITFFYSFPISSSKIQNFLLDCIAIHLLSQPTSQLFQVIQRLLNIMRSNYINISYMFIFKFINTFKYAFLYSKLSNLGFIFIFNYFSVFEFF